MYISENSFRVRYAETDQMGIVYHANYYVWFDMGRTELLRSLGYYYSELESKGVLLPVLETHCVNKKPARFDEYITVKTCVREMKGVRLTFNYEVHNSDGELLATGYTTHAFVNSEFRPIILKRSFPDIYEKLLSCAVDEDVVPEIHEFKRNTNK